MKKNKHFWAIRDMDNDWLISQNTIPVLCKQRRVARIVKSFLIPEVNWKVVKVKIVEISK